MVEILVSARKALEPTSYPRLQDFLDALGQETASVLLASDGLTAGLSLAVPSMTHWGCV
jgi:hypothetical protein